MTGGEPLADASWRHAGWDGDERSAEFDGADLDGPDLPSDVLAAALAEAVPGPHLLAWLAAVDARTVSRSARVDLLVAFERMAAWVAAGQARVLACLDDPAAVPIRRNGWPQVVAMTGPGKRWAVRCGCPRGQPSAGSTSRAP